MKKTLLLTLILIITSINAFSADKICMPKNHTKVPAISELTYHQARKLLLTAGWQPYQKRVFMEAATDPDIQAGNGSQFWKKGYHEIEACSGTGMAPCVFSFSDVYGNQLQVATTGEEYPKGNAYAQVDSFRFVCTNVELQSGKPKNSTLQSTPPASKLITERDRIHGFTVSRPNSWTIESPTFDAIRVKLGFTGHGYDGICNITVVPLPKISGQSQNDIDQLFNKVSFGNLFWQNSLKLISVDTKIIKVEPTRRGENYGQLINYSYSYYSEQLGSRIHGRAELFSHSRPGKNFAFTCNTSALTAADAHIAFKNELNSFEQFSASFYVTN